MQDELIQKVIERINSIPNIKEAISLVRKNSTGKMWLIGSAVYGSIIREMYGTELPVKDFDFIVENIKTPFETEEGVHIETNNYGNIKIKSHLTKIDVVPLSNIHSINRKGLPPTIEHYLLGTPFTVQSIAFDIDTQRIIGEKSFQAIQDKKVEVNDRDEAVYYAKIIHVTLEDCITDLAEKLNFTPVLPEELNS